MLRTNTDVARIRVNETEIEILVQCSRVKDHLRICNVDLFDCFVGSAGLVVAFMCHHHRSHFRRWSLEKYCAFINLSALFIYFLLFISHTWLSVQFFLQEAPSRFDWVGVLRTPGALRSRITIFGGRSVMTALTIGMPELHALCWVWTGISKWD